MTIRLVCILAIGLFAMEKVQAQSQWTQKHLISGSNQVLVECREFDQNGLLKEHWKYEASPQQPAFEIRRYHYDSAQVLLAEVDISVKERTCDSIVYHQDETGNLQTAVRYFYYPFPDRFSSKHATIEMRYPDTNIIMTRDYSFHGEDSILRGGRKTVIDFRGEKVESTYFTEGLSEYKTTEYFNAYNKHDHLIWHTEVFYDHSDTSSQPLPYARDVTTRQYKYAKSGQVSCIRFKTPDAQGKWRIYAVSRFGYDRKGKLKCEKEMIFTYRGDYGYNESKRKTRKTFRYRFEYNRQKL